MRSEKVRLAWIQGAITLIGAAVTYSVAAPFAAASFAFGGCVATFGTLFLAWRYVTGGRQEHLGAEWILRHAYRTALERFVLVACLLAIGMGILRLAPALVLAGFVCGQSAWLAAPVWMKLKKQNGKRD